MIPQLVAEQPLFSVQVRDAALVELPNLQSGFLAERPVEPLKLENQAEARQREIDNAMQLQICRQIFMLGNLFQAATNAHALLISENRELRQHILQRTTALEKEWLGIAEILSAKVNTLHCSLKKFHQELSADYKEAMNAFEISKTKPPHTCEGILGFKAGEALAKIWFYSLYAESDCGVGKYHLPAIEKMVPTLKDTLKANVKAEIQIIKKDMPQERSGINNPGHLFNLNEIVINNHPIQTFIQKCQKNIQSQEDLNLLVKIENASLEKIKLELLGVDGKFLRIFQNHLSHCFALSSSISYIVSTADSHMGVLTKNYNNLDQWGKNYWSSGGEYVEGAKLHDKISAHLKEVKAHVEALHKKESP